MHWERAVGGPRMSEAGDAGAGGGPRTGVVDEADASICPWEGSRGELSVGGDGGSGEGRGSWILGAEEAGRAAGSGRGAPGDRRQLSIIF